MWLQNTSLRTRYWVIAFVPALGAVGLHWLAVYAFGQYGPALFLATPFTMGYIAGVLVRFLIPDARVPHYRKALWLAIVGPAAVAALAMLALGKEGIVCIVMAVPLAFGPVCAGVVIAYWIHGRRSVPAAVVSSIALIAATIAGMYAESRLRREPVPTPIADSIVINAPADEVWNRIVNLNDVPQPSEWMYRAGLACPRETRIVTPGAGGVRLCKLSTGVLVEHIDVWRPGSILRWRTVSMPPPMKEMNPFHDVVDAPHLHGFYASPYGEFTLEAISASQTRVTRRTWYSHKLYPQAYWSFWCEMAISQLHRTVLNQLLAPSTKRV